MARPGMPGFSGVGGSLSSPVKYWAKYPSQYPGGGNANEIAVLKDIGTTTRIGASRKSAPRAARMTGSIRHSAPQPVKPGVVVVDREHGAGRDEEHDGDRRGEAKRQQLLDLLIDELRDHHVTRRAQQHRRHEKAEARDEHEQAA